MGWRNGGPERQILKQHILQSRVQLKIPQNSELMDPPNGIFGREFLSCEPGNLCIMNQFLKNHQLNKAEIGMTDESISPPLSGGMY